MRKQILLAPIVLIFTGLLIFSGLLAGADKPTIPARAEQPLKTGFLCVSRIGLPTVKLSEARPAVLAGSNYLVGKACDFADGSDATVWIPMSQVGVVVEFGTLRELQGYDTERAKTWIGGSSPVNMRADADPFGADEAEAEIIEDPASHHVPALPPHDADEAEVAETGKVKGYVPALPPRGADEAEVPAGRRRWLHVRVALPPRDSDEAEFEIFEEAR